jgi:hypothetical protein
MTSEPVPNTTLERSACQGPGLIDGPGSAHDRGATDARGKLAGASRHERPATRGTNHGESSETQLIGEIGDVVGPVEQRAAGFRLGTTEPRPIGHDDAHADRTRHVSIWMHQTTARDAMEEEHRDPARVSVLRVRESPPVTQTHSFRGRSIAEIKGAFGHDVRGG